MAVKMRFVALLLALSALGANAATYTYPGTNLRAQSHVTTTGSGLPGCSPGTPQYSGFVNINSTVNKNYFYWAFGPRSNRTDAPVVLWMTGGPGCSSTLAALIENGPCHVNTTTGELYDNPYGWNNDAYLIYVDQPAGVGFSTADISGYDSNEAEVSEDMYWFLQDFLYEAHPEFIKNNNELFVFGESYGGHFAPATAHKIYQRNQQSKTNPAYKYLNLAGLGIGNGLVDPYIQYQHYEDLAYNWCLKVLGEPCVNIETAAIMNASLPSCLTEIAACVADPAGLGCLLARATCNAGQLLPYQLTGKNVYDIRKPCEGELCYNLEKVVEFMNLPQTQKDFGVPQQTWSSCNMLVNLAFMADWFANFDGYVADMLNGASSFNSTKSIRVLVYAGDMDFICNWIGNKAWALNLDWHQKYQFNAAKDIPYFPDNKTSPVASIRYVNGPSGPMQFSFAQVYNAGHMSPMDQPAAISSMLDRFLNNKGWI